jgi:cell division transport system ATP-binding protein
MTQIVLSSVSKRDPGGHDALANITLTVETGELVFITGHSGAGKSTLLKLMAAIERPTKTQRCGRCLQMSLLQGQKVANGRRRHGSRRSCTPSGIKCSLPKV